MDNSIFSNIRSSNPSKNQERMKAQLAAWMDDENTCHYFAIQRADQVIHPSGRVGRPFYDLDQANRKLEELKTKHPDIDWYISYGAFDTDALNFDDQETPMWERIWLNKHEWRLTKLRVLKMSPEQLLEIQPNFNELIAWQEAFNVKGYCHYYFAKCIKEYRYPGMTSQCFFDLRSAIAAKILFSKDMPDRDFQIFNQLMKTESLLEMDKKTEDTFQELIDAHKERLAQLDGINHG